MKQTLIISTLLLILFSCSNQEKANLVIIKGTVLSDNVDNVKFEWIKDNPIINNSEQYIAELDSLSRFSINIPIERMATGRIVTGYFSHEVCFLPGDNYNIEIEADTIKFTGKGAEKNNFLYATEKNGTSDWSYYSFSNNGNLNPSDFLLTMKEFKQKRLDFIDTYPNKKLLEPEFINYYKLNTQVIYEYLIQSYPERYAYKSNIHPDSIDLPEEYSRLNQFTNIVDDRKIITGEYTSNLRNFIYKKRKEVMKADSSLNYQEAIYTVLFDSLQGKTQEYVLAKWICFEFSFNNYDTIAVKKYEEIEKDELSKTTVKNALDKYNMKQALIGQPLHPEFDETMLEDTTNTKLTFGEMMDKYKGKVVYLDIWSLNCGPCRASMPYSKELKERLTGLPIEFVYIAQDPPGNDVWKKIFNVSLTKDNHYRMVKHDWGTSRMLKFMEINWVPCYMIFDKQGHLIDFNADGPYVSQNGESRIEMKLKELANK